MMADVSDFDDSAGSEHVLDVQRPLLDVCVHHIPVGHGEQAHGRFCEVGAARVPSLIREYGVSGEPVVDDERRGGTGVLEDIRHPPGIEDAEAAPDRCPVTIEWPERKSEPGSE